MWPERTWIEMRPLALCSCIRAAARCDRDDTEVAVLDERSRVLTGLPGHLGVQAMNLSRQAELHERIRSPRLQAPSTRAQSQSPLMRASGRDHQRVVGGGTLRLSERQPLRYGKVGLIGFTKTLWMELGEHNIRAIDAHPRAEAQRPAAITNSRAAVRRRQIRSPDSFSAGRAT